MNGTSVASSSRPSMATPMTAPRTSMRRTLGWLQKRYAHNTTRATRTGVSVSDSSSSSLIQMFGYTATRNAAINPTRRPATARPLIPHSVTAPAPMTQHHTRWAKNDLNPTTDEAASTTTNNGGQLAICTTWEGWSRKRLNGSMKPRPSAKRLAALWK